MDPSVGNHRIILSGSIFCTLGSIPALVHGYMRVQALLQGDVYTGSLEQLSSELRLAAPLVRESLERLEQARLLRDITPEKGDLAHAWVVRSMDADSGF